MKSKVVIEMRGGTLAGLYTNDPEIEIHFLDWDEVHEGNVSDSSVVKADRIEEMPSDTRERVERTPQEKTAKVK